MWKSRGGLYREQTVSVKGLGSEGDVKEHHGTCVSRHGLWERMAGFYPYNLDRHGKKLGFVPSPRQV